MNARVQVNIVDQEQRKIELAAEEMLQEMRPMLKGWLAKKLIKKVKARFERDEIDEKALEYIVVNLVNEMGSFEEILTGNPIETVKKTRADQIIFDIKAVMNGSVAITLLKLFGKNGAQDGLRSFEESLHRVGLGDEYVPDVALILWERIKASL